MGRPSKPPNHASKYAFHANRPTHATSNSTPLRAKTEIGAHVYRIRRASTERRIHEGHRRLGGNAGVNGKTTTQSTPVSASSFHTLIVGHEFLQAISMKTLIGVDVESEGNDLPPLSAAGALRLVDKEPMALMHTVEHAERARSANKQCVVELLRRPL